MKPGPILVVEDDPGDEKLILRALRKKNFVNEVVVARDGVEALDHIFGTGPHEARGPLTPALVLLDVKMPRLDGFVVLERIRGNERTKRLPVVMLTSSDNEEDMGRSYDLGANGYVRKPVEFKAFSEAVGQLGLYWLLLNEPPPESG